MMLLPLFFSLHLALALYHSSVESCPKVTGLSDNSTLMGVCPNNGTVRVIPVNRAQEYECSFVRINNPPHRFSWIINGTVYDYSPNPSNLQIDFNLNLVGNSVLRFTPQDASTTYIQCILCSRSAPSCFSSNFSEISPDDYIATQPVQITAFGVPHSLSHQLTDNNTVLLSWLPPPVPVSVVLTYNIIIMDSTNSSMIVTNINITNITNITISPNDIAGYTNCNTYQWGVSAGTVYGFTNITLSSENFTFISGPTVSDELVVSGNIEFNVTAPCNISLLNDYTYTLLQRDYCQRLLNSSQINVTLDDIDDITPNTLIPINASVQSLILNSTWSISVQVSNRFGNNSTTYTNITNTGIIQKCNPVPSSITHLSSSDMLLTSTITDSPTTSLNPTHSSSSPTTGSPTNTGGGPLIIGAAVGGGGAVVLLLLVIIILVGVCVVKNKKKSYNLKGDDKVKEIKMTDTSTGIESPKAKRLSEESNMDKNIDDKDYQEQTPMPGSIPDPTYQEPSTCTFVSDSASIPVSSYTEPVTAPQTYSIPIKPSSIAPPIPKSESKSPIEVDLVDMPGYTEVPAHMKKGTGSKRKQETRNPNSPLPRAPVDSTVETTTPAAEAAQHQYADLQELREGNKVHNPPPTIINDVKYAEVANTS